MSFDNCTRISPACPIEETTYGYYPSLAGNALLASVFGLCAVAQVLLGIRCRHISYSTPVFLGCVGEVIGYIGRVMLHNNPWSSGAMLMNILLLILSPSFFAAALYLTLKHTIEFYGPAWSMLKPKTYPRLFITCDIIGFITQLIGGVLTGADSKSTVDIGNAVMIAGIAFQAGIMALAGLLAVAFVVRRARHMYGSFAKPSSPKEEKRALYLLCMTAAYIFILIRCIYRIPEMGGGWGNSMMQNEVEFMVLEGAMVASGAILLCAGHPGLYAAAFTEDKASTGFEMSQRLEGDDQA
ncbi:hypothetical protein H2200_010852 [Cladophialophora chaetospira]|uniref:Sphingoid long-chain base transporter RSB1 n=1 Tax=Cladophialophora chaetospira TaxID=386627 RepID=A0AA38X0Y9_9EURO|nr:hypothetical protein H2200_010852 [Cladophialophora chaetospira]